LDVSNSEFVKGGIIESAIPLAFAECVDLLVWQHRENIPTVLAKPGCDLRLITPLILPSFDVPPPPAPSLNRTPSR